MSPLLQFGVLRLSGGIAVLAVAFLSSSVSTCAAELRGQVTDAVTKLPIDGATLTLDAAPADGTPEFAAESDVFGFFTFTNLPSGGFHVVGERPGYLSNAVDVTFSTAATRLGQGIPLTPIVDADGPRFDIAVEVVDAFSGLPLGDVPVRADRYLQEDDASPTNSTTVVTGENGRASIAGAVRGYYTFRFNDGPGHPKWEIYAPTNRTLLMSDHLAYARLKPIPQDMSVRVVGFDPKAGTNGLPDQPLDGIYVELEGVGAAPSNEVVVPVRVGVTTNTGLTKFTGLPAIPWRVVARRFGYAPSTNFIYPGSGDILPGTNEVSVPIEPTTLDVNLHSVYFKAQMMTGLVVRLEGLTNTSTEGIQRGVLSEEMPIPGESNGIPVARFDGLLSGAYHLSVTGSVWSPMILSGSSVATNRFEVRFSASEFVDLLGGMPSHEDLMVEPMRATVRVRYYAADQMADFPVPGSSGVFERRPVYARRPLADAMFAQSAVDPQIMPPMDVMAFGTDDSGEAVVSVLPGVYGVRVPSLPEYFGDKARLYDVSTGKTIEQGWPFADDPNTMPFPGSPHHALGLVFSSGHEYELELYTRMKTYEVRGEVSPDLLDPVTQRIVALSEDNYTVAADSELPGGKAILTGPGGPKTNLLTLVDPAITNSSPPPPDSQFQFSTVEPGSYSISLSHPTNTFTAYTGGSSLAFTLPGWGPPGIVDSGDMVAAAAGLFPLETKVLEGAGGAPAFAAYHEYSNTVRVDWYSWDTNLNGGAGDYVFVGYLDRPDYFQIDPSPFSVLRRYAGIPPFHFDGREWDMFFVINSSNWFRATVTATNSGDEYVFNAYDGGPLHNLIGPISEAYSLTVKAVSDAAPDLSVTNIDFTLADGTKGLTPYHVDGYNSSYVPGAFAVTNGFWTGTNHEYTVTVTGGSDFAVTLKVKRGMGVRGLVQDSMTGLPVTNAEVHVFDRFGGLLKTAVTGTNGQYAVSALDHVQPIFVDVSAPGYVEGRVRREPSGDSPDLEVTNDLVRLPPPELKELAVDRFGSFLPGVRKAGNTGNFTQFNAESPLTMHWRLRAKEQTFVLDLPEFDGATGAPRPNSFASLTDNILETWLVDWRAFPTNLPDTNSPAAVMSWLKEVRDGVYPSVFYQRVPFTVPATNGTVEASSPVRLWELPAGEFKPVFVSITRRGVALVTPLTYSGSESYKTLRGLTIPKWLASAADIMGNVAGFKEATGTDVTDEQVERYMPAGRFKALPEFTADITTNESGFVNYDYGLSVSWKEGEDTPRSGLLALAPRTMGMDFEAGMNFGMEGLSNRFFLTASGSVNGEGNLKRVIPAGLGYITPPKGSYSVGASTTGAESLADSGHPELLELGTHVYGSANARVEVNLRPVTSKIPYIGPVLLALDESKGLQVLAVLTGGVGLTADSHWSTVYPSSRPQGSDILGPTNHVYSRHFMGGQEILNGTDTVGTNSFGLCFRLGTGLDVKALNGRLGAKGLITLEGAYQDCGPEPVMLITPNSLGDWPPISRVNGEVNLSLELTADVGPVKFGHKFKMNAFKFDHHFGTEPSLQLVPVTSVATVLLPGGGIPAAYQNTGPDRVSHFYPAGATATAPGTLVYTDINPATSNMVLRLVANGEPVTIAEAGGILSVDTARLPSGKWLVVWSEIAPTDVGNLFPASTIKYSLSDTNGRNWSAPGTVVSLSDAASELRLVISDTLAGLVYLHTADGLLATRYSIAGSTWDGATWSAPSELLVDADVRGFDALGSGDASSPPALVAWSDASGVARSMTWNGSTTTGPHIAGTNILENISLARCGGAFVLGWGAISGDIDLASFDGTSAWSPLGSPVTNHLASDLQLASAAVGGTNLLVLAWANAANAREINYAFADCDGSLVKSAALAAFADSGDYSHLLLEPDAKGARLTAQYSDTNSTAVREFVLTPSGVAPWLQALTTTAPNAIQFQLVASPEQSYRLQVSSNLVRWTDVLTMTATNSPVVLQDAMLMDQHFYRAVSP